MNRIPGVTSLSPGQQLQYFVYAVRVLQYIGASFQLKNAPYGWFTNNYSTGIVVESLKANYGGTGKWEITPLSLAFHSIYRLS